MMTEFSIKKKKKNKDSMVENVKINKGKRFDFFLKRKFL